MKRIIISILLLAACLTAAFIEMYAVGGDSEATIQAIEETDRCMRRDDFTAALKKCSEIEKQWAETEEREDALLIHDYVDSVGLNLAKMRSHIENGNPDLYFAESENAKRALTSLKDSEYPLLENIF